MQDNTKLKKYLQIYRKNPNSKVFVLLAEFYRKRGDKKRAEELCRKGIKIHPQLSSGYIALALVLLDLNQPGQAASILEKATLITPENILAYKLLGQCYIRLKNPEKTLASYKMLLFLDPNNKVAQQVIKKLETSTAIQYDSTGFAFKSIKEVAKHITKKEVEKEPPLHPVLNVPSLKEKSQFESRISLISALIYRKSFSQAKLFLQEMKPLYPKQKQILLQLENQIPPLMMEKDLNFSISKRDTLLSQTTLEHTFSALSRATGGTHQGATHKDTNYKTINKIQKLKKWLNQIEDRAYPSLRA